MPANDNTRRPGRPRGSIDRHGRAIRAVTEREGRKFAAEVGESIRHAREEVDVSVDELAAATGYTTFTLWKWERGKHPPRISALYQIAVALGISVESLLPD